MNAIRVVRIQVFQDGNGAGGLLDAMTKAPNTSKPCRARNLVAAMYDKLRMDGKYALAGEKAFVLVELGRITYARSL